MKDFADKIDAKVKSESLKGISPLAYKIFRVYPKDSDPFVWLQMGSEQCWSLVSYNYLPNDYGLEVGALAKEVENYMSTKYPSAIQLETFISIPDVAAMSTSELFEIITSYQSL